MNHLSKYIVAAAIAALCASACPAGASAEGRGTKSAGVRAGYITHNESAVAGIYFQYSFSRHFRLSPTADYVFRHNDTDAFILNVDAQFPFDFSDGRWAVYPFAGLSYANWTRRHNVEEQRLKESVRTSDFGVNAGAGIEWRLTTSLKMMAEAKYGLVKDHEGGVFTIGLGYVF